MKKIILISASLLAAACTVSELGQQAQPEGSNGITATFEQPVFADEPETKSLDKGLHFYFEDKDHINVYSDQPGECMVYTLRSEEDLNGMFSVNGFNLKNDDYYAVYPSRPVDDPGCISFSLAGQNQDANDDASGLSAYDLNHASASIYDNRGSFHFKHKIAWLRVVIPPGKAGTYKEVTVSADGGVANTIQLDATRGDVTAVPVSADEKMVLTLNNGNGIEVAENESFYAYVTVPQGVYTNLHVICGDYDKLIPGETAIAAGYAYPVIMMTKLSKPTVTPKSGEVKRGTLVYLESAERARIFYTLDGTTPTAESAMYMYNGIEITEACTLKAIAIDKNWYDSDVMTATYTIGKAPKPTVSVSSEGVVTITSTLEDAVLHYSLDGTTPNSSSPVYDPSTGLTVPANTNIKAIDLSPGYDGGYVTNYFHRPIEVLDCEDIEIVLDRHGNENVIESEHVEFVFDGMLHSDGTFYMDSRTGHFIYCKAYSAKTNIIGFSVKSCSSDSKAIEVVAHDILSSETVWSDDAFIKQNGLIELLEFYFDKDDTTYPLKVDFDFAYKGSYNRIAIRPPSTEGLREAYLSELTIYLSDYCM